MLLPLEVAVRIAVEVTREAARKEERVRPTEKAEEKKRMEMRRKALPTKGNTGRSPPRFTPSAAAARQKAARYCAPLP